MHLVLTGATGLVGSAVLDAMLRAKDVTKISILSRRPVPMADNAQDPRVNVIIHRDFEHYDASVLEKLQGANGCVWALGISQTQVGAEEYVKITKDYARAAARAFAEIPRQGDDSSNSSNAATSATTTTTTKLPSEPFRFVYVSGEGATQNPGRFSAIFARIKGETEQTLADMTGELAGKLQADSARPAFVDAAGHTSIQPFLPQASLPIRLTRGLLSSPIKTFYRPMHSPTPMLGDFLTQMAMGKVDGRLEGTGAFKLGQGWVVENVGIRRMMGL